MVRVILFFSVALMAIGMLCMLIGSAEPAPLYFWTGQTRHVLPTTTAAIGFPYWCMWDTLMAADSLTMTPIAIDGKPFTTSEITVSATTDTVVVQFFSTTGADGFNSPISRGFKVLKGEAVTFPFHGIDSVRVSIPAWAWEENDAPGLTYEYVDDGDVALRIIMVGYRTGWEDADLPLKRTLPIATE